MNKINKFIISQIDELVAKFPQIKCVYHSFEDCMGDGGQIYWITIYPQSVFKRNTNLIKETEKMRDLCGKKFQYLWPSFHCGEPTGALADQVYAKIGSSYKEPVKTVDVSTEKTENDLLKVAQEKQDKLEKEVQGLNEKIETFQEVVDCRMEQEVLAAQMVNLQDGLIADLLLDLKKMNLSYKVVTGQFFEDQEREKKQVIIMDEVPESQYGEFDKFEEKEEKVNEFLSHKTGHVGFYLLGGEYACLAESAFKAMKEGRAKMIEEYVADKKV